MRVRALATALIVGAVALGGGVSRAATYQAAAPISARAYAAAHGGMTPEQFAQLPAELQRNVASADDPVQTRAAKERGVQAFFRSRGIEPVVRHVGTFPVTADVFRGCDRLAIPAGADASQLRSACETATSGRSMPRSGSDVVVVASDFDTCHLDVQDSTSSFLFFKHSYLIVSLICTRTVPGISACVIFGAQVPALPFTHAGGGPGAGNFCVVPSTAFEYLGGVTFAGGFFGLAAYPYYVIGAYAGKI